MKQLIKKLNFYFDYYVGYFLYSGQTKWSNYILSKYPEEFPNEIEYLKETQKTD